MSDYASKPVTTESVAEIKKYVDYKVDQSKSGGRDYKEIKLAVDRQTGEYKALDWNSMSTLEKVAIRFTHRLTLTATEGHVVLPHMTAAFEKSKVQNKEPENITKERDNITKAKELCEHLTDRKGFISGQSKARDPQEDIKDGLIVELEKTPAETKETLYKKIEASTNPGIKSEFEAAVYAYKENHDAIIAHVLARADNVKSIFQ